VTWKMIKLQEKNVLLKMKFVRMSTSNFICIHGTYMNRFAKCQTVYYKNTSVVCLIRFKCIPFNMNNITSIIYRTLYLYKWCNAHFV